MVPRQSNKVVRAFHEPHEFRSRAPIESGGGPPHSKMLVLCPLNNYTFVASILGSGEARRGSIPAAGCDRGATKSRTQKRRNPPGGMSFSLSRRCSFLTDP